MLHDPAERIVRRETTALKAAAIRTAGDAEEWTSAVTAFYSGEHCDYVASSLRVAHAQAGRYCDRRAAALVADGVAALADGPTVGVAALVEMAEEAT